MEHHNNLDPLEVIAALLARQESDPMVLAWQDCVHKSTGSLSNLPQEMVDMVRDKLRSSYQTSLYSTLYQDYQCYSGACTSHEVNPAAMTKFDDFLDDLPPGLNRLPRYHLRRQLRWRFIAREKSSKCTAGAFNIKRVLLHLFYPYPGGRAVASAGESLITSKFAQDLYLENLEEIADTDERMYHDVTSYCSSLGRERLYEALKALKSYQDSYVPPYPSNSLL